MGSRSRAALMTPRLTADACHARRRLCGWMLGDLRRREGRLVAAMDAYRSGLGHRAAPGTTTMGTAPAEPPKK